MFLKIVDVSDGKFKTMFTQLPMQKYSLIIMLFHKKLIDWIYGITIKPYKFVS